MRSLGVIAAGIALLIGCSCAQSNQNDSGLNPQNSSRESCRLAMFTENPIEHIVIELEEPIRVRQVRGTVKSGVGEWPEGVEILVELVEPTEPRRLRGARVDSDGHFSFESVTVGEYCFRAGAIGWQSVLAYIIVASDSDPETAIEVELPLGV